uniref:Secreted protein n=1 Tax=Ascaris lumbricoides TaxID=6252 RepID=A0A0M3HP12_ASCLU
MTVLFISSIFCPSSHIALFLLFKAVCCWIALFTDSFVNTRSTALLHSSSSGNNFFTSASLDQFYEVFLYDMAYYTIFVNVLRRLHVYMQPTLVDVSDEHFKLDKLIVVRLINSFVALTLYRG